MPNSAQTASDIAHAIQLSVSPVFLLAGTGALLNMFATRLTRVVDRARHLTREFTPKDHPHHARQVWELRLLDQRMALISWAIFLGCSSAAMICFVVISLFVSAIAGWSAERGTAFAFIFAMSALLLALVFFLIEIRLARKTIRIQEELLERQ